MIKNEQKSERHFTKKIHEWQTPLTIREMKTKTTKRDPARSLKWLKLKTNKDEGVKDVLSGGTQNGTPAFGNAWQFLLKLNRHFPYNQGILFQGIYPKEMKTCVHTKTEIFMAAQSLSSPALTREAGEETGEPVMPSYCRTLLSNRKEQTTDPSDHVENSQIHRGK